MNRRIVLQIAMVSLFGADLSTNANAAGVNFNRDIRPILSDKCFSCHGLDQNARKADLRLDQRESALATKAIIPGQPDKSALIERIFASDDETVMPPVKANKPLTDEQKQLLRKWIEEGAEYHPHWSFIPVPKSIPVPQPADPSHWIRSPIDAFVLERLRNERIEPAEETTREKWLRRASFDLTGLPPSLQDISQFVDDRTPHAYEQAANRLLDSPAFGERMTNEWLDIARYADTFGYQADRDTHLWPWRDWVIRAFNENLPYDQFITWQTAGDLLPNATRDQKLATAFNRLHRQTNEGGSIEQEFRLAYISDRVVTNGTAFLGLTFECCRCHNHKYDPITQAEFYKMAAFFSNIDEHGLYSHFTETAPTPTLLLFEGDQQSKHDEIVAKIHAEEGELKRTRDEAKARFDASSLSAAKIDDLNSLAVALSPPKPDSQESATPSPTVAEAVAMLAPKLRISFDDAKPTGENKLVPGISGQAIEFGGDDAFPCVGSGQYGRTSPFSFSLWVKPVENKPRVVVLHQCVAAEDAAYRGISLILDEGFPQFSLVHFWPGNAIRIQSRQPIPINEWTHIAVTYDGSSKAAGIGLCVNGRPADVSVVKDQLTRDIKHRSEWGDSSPKGVELSLGARFRDVGFRGGAIDELSIYDRELSPMEVALLSLEFSKPDSAGSKTPLDFAAPARFSHYLLRIDEPYQSALKKLQGIRNDENELITVVRQIMVMQEMPEPRPTYILKRGAYDAPGDPVTADTPASVLPLSADFPRNRLGLAKWMTDQRNPLTSRVAVNRFWSLLFGRGLVASVEDFGGQGQPPSHPELLDWLARDFVDRGWNVKDLCRRIVLSATYRQSSVPRDSKLYVDDPDNRLLGRGSRYRLTAEQLRDNCLAVSGLLVPKIGGPSVMPYQPAGLWEEAGTGKSYQQSKGEGLYRRSMYTFWRRTSPPPSMLTFDATGRESCTARRERTSTPLQALVLLNDPQFVEASRVLAEKLMKTPSTDQTKASPPGQPVQTETSSDARDSKSNVQQPEVIDARIRTAFRLLTSRNPSAKESQILSRLYREQRLHFETIPKDAIELLSVGETPRDTSLTAADHAAMTILVKTLMSFDECVNKR